PRDPEAAAGDRQHRPPRVRILFGPRAGSLSTVRLLRRRLYPAAVALRRERPHRGRRVPRQRRADLPRAGRDQRETIRGLVMIARVVIAATLLSAPAFAQATSPARTMVMPFENVTREGRIFWLTEAAAVLLTDDLNAPGAAAITRVERQQAFERLQVPPVAALTDATVI